MSQRTISISFYTFKIFSLNDISTLDTSGPIIIVYVMRQLKIIG